MIQLIVALAAYCAFSFSIQARSLGMVLPFYIGGNTQAIQSLSLEPARDFQSASFFLLRHHRKYNFLSLEKSHAILRKLQFDPKKTLSPEQAARICMEADLSYLIAGKANIQYGDRKTKKPLRILLGSSTFSCRSRLVTKRASSSADSIFSLQDALRRLMILSSSFFAKAKPLVLKKTSGSSYDLAVVLDFSGSMREDIKEILKHLAYWEHSLPSKSRLGIVSIEDKNLVKTLPFHQNWRSSLSLLKKKKARGETNIQGLLEALAIIVRYKHWQNQPKILLFTDIEIPSQSSFRIRSLLQSLKAKNLSLCSFSLLNQTKATKNFWSNEAAAFDQNLRQKNVSYGIYASLAKGGNIFFIQQGKHFFYTKNRVERAIRSNQLTRNNLHSIQTSDYRQEELHLERIPSAFASKSHDKVLRKGRVISGLRASIRQCESQKEKSKRNLLTTEETNTRVLLRNQGDVFWIDLSQKYASLIRPFLSKKIYIGFHFQSEPRKRTFKSYPHPVYIQRERDVPRLFLLSRKQIQGALPYQIQEMDTWFIYSEVLEMKHEKDIRE